MYIIIWIINKNVNDLMLSQINILLMPMMNELLMHKLQIKYYPYQ